MRRSCYLLILLVLSGLSAVFVAGCRQETADRGGGQTPLVETDTQLKINQEALFRGASEDVRLDAAMVMLFGDRPLERQILTDALKQTENRAARIAVCRALVVCRETRRTIKGVRDFIGPLAEMLKTEDAWTARYAADALLIFDYDEIDNILNQIAINEKLTPRARMNAIYAMKVQFDLRAITRIIELVNDKDKQVADAARETLNSLGIPVSKDQKRRAQIISELRARGMERFQRDWMVRQEARVGTLEKERDQWRKLYLGALDKLYAGFGDEVQRGKMVTEQLGSSETAVRLWALDKASQWRIGTQSKLPAELGPILVKLISDENRDVRLATARILSLTGELSSPQRLAEQLGVEKDEEVKLALFVALGAACQYALVPTTGTQLSPELRKQTLEWAAQYLNDEDAKKSHRGAEVVRKLLEPGGLEETEAQKYMELLVERYRRTEQTPDGSLRGELLETMARLCGQSSYKALAANRFSGLFEKAMSDEADIVREAAVDGLVCVDKAKALRILSKDYLGDTSQIVRKKTLELAEDVGGKDDLSWLWEKVANNADSKDAWRAMMKIFNGCDSKVVEEWLGKLDTQAGRPIDSAPSTTTFEGRQGKQKLTDEQWVSFLELAVRKAAADNRNAMAKSAREKLAPLYIKAGQYEQAAECLGKLRETAKTAEQKDAILGQLIEVYLRWPKIEAATRLINNCLLEKDLGADSAVVRSIDAFWEKPSGTADANGVLYALRSIKPAEKRPGWERQIARWTALLGSPNKQEPAEPNAISEQGS